MWIPVDWPTVSAVLNTPPPDFVHTTSADLNGLTLKNLGQIQVQAVLTDPDLGGEVIARAKVPLHLPNQAVYLPDGTVVAVPPAPKPPGGLPLPLQMKWCLQEQRRANLEILRCAQQYKWATLQWLYRHGGEIEHGLDAPIEDEYGAPMSLHEVIAGQVEIGTIEELLEGLALTRMERLVAYMLSDGSKQVDIANCLGVTPAYISKVVAALRSKIPRR